MLSLRRQKPVDIVEIALYILAIIPLTDAYDTCDVSGRLTVTGRKSYPKHLTVDKDFRVICSDTNIAVTIISYRIFLLECINKFDDGKCDEWASMGYCNGPNHQSMFIQCKRSCGFCSKYDVI